MMIRDRTLRAVSLFALGSTALIVAAGAAWTTPPEHHPKAAVTTRAVTTRHAAASDDPTMHFVARPVARPAATARVAPAVTRLALPRSLPASLLPAGTTLPTNAPPPSDPWVRRTPTEIGRIMIPAIGVNQPVFEGVDQAAFAHGVGHWPGSAAPGGWGNAVFGGHRTTQTHPFLDTDKLHAGDHVTFVMQNGWTFVYSVTRVFVVPQTALWIADQKPGRTLTMFTCNPKGSATQRLVTSGKLLKIITPT
jgi:LPXTG-site transpeptidase (sortase) family protein